MSYEELKESCLQGYILYRQKRKNTISASQMDLKGEDKVMRFPYRKITIIIAPKVCSSHPRGSYIFIN